MCIRDRDNADADRTTAWGRASFDALKPFAGMRRYANYLGADEDSGAAASAAYGQNLAKLRQLKTRYDPNNIFHHNVNIPPA